MGMGFRSFHSSCVIHAVRHDVCCVIVSHSIGRLLNSRAKRRLTLIPLSTNTYISDALCVIHFPLNDHSPGQ